MSSSTVTYTSISSDYDEPSDAGSLGVVVYGYDGLPMHPVDPYVEAALQAPKQAPPSLDYVPGPEHPPSTDYVPDPEEPEQAPLSLDYVPEPEYPKYLVPSDAEAPMEDQPLPDAASPTALSPGYVADFDSEEDPKEDPEEDPNDGGDDAGDESSDDDDDDDDDEEEEEQEASEDDDEEKEEHPAPADSSVVPVDDPVPSAEDTEAFKTDESALTPVASPRRRRARMSVRPQTPMSAAIEALIAMIPSPPLPLPSPPTTSPTYAEAPLGYRTAEIRLRATSPSIHHPLEIPSPPLLLPSTTHRDDLPEAEMPLQKRARFTAPTSRFEVGESSSAAAARQAGHTLAHTADYGFIDTLDASIRASESRVMTTVGVVNEKDDRALLGAQVSILRRERRYFRSMASSYEHEAVIAQHAWSHSKSRIQAMEAQIRALQRDVDVLQRKRIGDGQTDGPHSARA
ncbi:hypothetical protein Tco_0333464 [Tanacetum coccineum]